MVDKEQRTAIGLSTLVAWVTLVPAFWFLAKPFVVKAVADDMGTKIQEETKPLSDAFRILLMRDISEMRRQITAMEYRWEQNRAAWTLEDAQELSRMREALRNHEEALKALERE